MLVVEVMAHECWCLSGSECDTVAPKLKLLYGFLRFLTIRNAQFCYQFPQDVIEIGKATIFSRNDVTRLLIELG